MSEVFCCDDKETLLAYLYGEAPPDLCRQVERHLRGCGACSQDSESLQSVRSHLQTWIAPEPVLGLSVDSANLRMATPPADRRWVARSYEWPVWAQVAAAVFVAGVGLALANIQVRSTPDGTTVTTGWIPATPSPATASVAYGSAPASSGPVTAAADSAATSQEWRVALVELEQALRREMATPPVATRTADTVRRNDSSNDAALWRRVAMMLEASEERQRQDMALRMMQAEQVWNVRRQTDLASFQRSLSSLQSRTFAVQANQKEVIDHVNRLQRVNFTPPNQ